MADARYVVDIILKARDDTAAAFAAATRNMEVFNRLQDETNRQNERQHQSFSELNREISTSHQKLTSLMREVKGASAAAVDEQVKLERAARSYVAALGDANRSGAEQAQALKNLRSAQEDYSKAIAEARKGQKGWDTERAQSLAKEIADTNIRIEQARQLQGVYVEAARAQAEADREAAQQRAQTQREYAELQQSLLAAENRQRDEAAQREQARLDARQQAEERIAAARNDQIREEAELQEALHRAENRRLDELAERQQQVIERRWQAEQRAAELRDRQARDEADLQEALAQAENRRLDEQAERVASRMAAEREAEQRMEGMRREREQREAAMPRRYIAALQEIQRLESQRTQAMREGDLVQVARIELDAGRVRAEAEELAAGLRALLDHIEANVDLDGGEATAHAAEVRAQLDAILSRDIKFNVEADIDRASVERAKHAIDDVEDHSRRSSFTLRGLFQAAGEGFDESTGRIAAFDNFMRGLMVLGITVFFNQLVLLAGAAAGALAALASSAMMAGAALGGALTAGIAQAIPMLGILATFVSRFKAVTDAANQAQLLQQQQSYKGAQQSKKQADATNAVANAMDTLRGALDSAGAAHDRVAEAQKKVTEARRDAAKQLQDLILAEREAELAARGASLSQEEAQAALRQAISQGDVASIQRRQLGVEEADLGADQAQRRLEQQRRDAARMRSQGIEGAPGVVQARKGLEDAQRAVVSAERAVDRARRGVDQAKRGADLAGQNINAAAGKLNFLLGRMSDAEREMYRVLMRLQDAFRGFAQYVTEPLTRGMTFAMRRIITLLRDPEIRNAMRALAGNMADFGKRIFSAFTSDEAMAQFLRLAREGGRNLKPLADIAINMSRAFMDMAEAASPALREILDWFKKISDRVADFMRSGRETGTLQQFFSDGVVHLKAWGNLLWQIVRLFAAIAGPGGGAKTGLQLVNDMAKGIRGWADAINDPDTKISKFFRNFFKLSREILGALGPIFKSIGREIELTFTKDGVGAVRGFSFFMANTLIPALGNFIRLIGRATAQLGHFAEQHPGLARLSAAVIAFALTFSTVARAMTIFGPITGVLKYLATHLGLAAGASARLAAIGARLGPLFARAGSMLLGPWGLAAAAVFLLLKRFGLLDDLARGIGDAFSSLWRKVRPAIENFLGGIKELTDAFGEGGGLLDVLKPLMTFITREVISVIQLLADLLGGTLAMAFNVAGDALKILARLLRGEWGGAWDAAKDMAKHIVDGLLNPFKALGRHLVRLIKAAVDMILDFLGIKSPSTLFRSIGTNLVRGLVNGFLALPRALLNVASNAWDGIKEFFGGLSLRGIGSKLAHGLASGFKGVGGFILDTISGAIGTVGNFSKKFINSIIDLLNKAMPDKIKVPGAPDIPLPDNPIPKLRQGGPIGTGYGGGDRRLILAEDGEHMLTKEEVRSAGGHSAIFMLRSLLGGGGQARGGKFALGGRIGSDTATRAQAGLAQAQATVNVDADVEGFASRWRKMWAEVVASTRRNTNEVQKQIREMRVGIETTLGRLSRVWMDRWENISEYMHERWRRMSSFAQDSADDMWRGVRGSVMNLQRTVWRGMSYIGNATNDSLKAFDAEPVKIGLRPPPGEGKASGGWIGTPGERGRDAVPTWLGRGEAVLNWAHQKVVNSALWNQYGTTLDGLFKNTRALHAGGHGEAVGYAGGGYTGPGHSGAGFTPIWNMAKRKFGMTYFTGFDGHNRMTSSGNVSDHFYHRALDMGNGVLTSQEDALNRFIKTKIPQVVKQLIWRDKDQFNGYPIGGHQDHIHLAMPDAFAQNAQKMAKILSRAMRGLSIADLVRGVSGEDIDVDHVDRVKVTGPVGKMRQFAQKVLDKIRKAANSKIDKEALKLEPGADAAGLHGDTYDGPLDRRFPAHHSGDVGGHVQLSPAQVRGLAERAGLPGTTFEQIAHGESNYYPGIISSDGGYGLWQMTPRVWGGAALAAMNKLGGVMAMLNPWKNALMAKFLYDSAGKSISPWYGTRYVTAARAAMGGFPAGKIQEFAKGGRVEGPDGQPVPIVAHAGEWVLNKIQQAKLAQMLGATVGQLRDRLGFSGGPTSFAGGGDVPAGQKASNLTQTLVDRVIALDPRVMAEAERHERTMEALTRRRKLTEINLEGKAEKAALDRIDKQIDAEEKLNKKRQDSLEKLGDHLRQIVERAGASMRPEQFRQYAARRGVYDLPTVARRTAEGVSTEIARAQGANRVLGRRSTSGAGLDQYTRNMAAITSSDGGLLAQLDAALERAAGQAKTALDLAQVGFQRIRRTVRVNGVKMVRDLLKAVPVLNDPAKIAEAQVENLRVAGEGIKQQRTIAASALQGINRRIAVLSRGGVTKGEQKQYEALMAQRTAAMDKMDELDAEFAQNRSDHWDARVAAFTARTDAALKNSDNTAKWADYFGNIAKTLGNTDMIRNAGQAQLAGLRERQQVLGDRYQRAVQLAKTDPRWQAEADRLGDEYLKTSEQIQQQIVENFQNDLAAIDKSFDRRTSAIERSGRLNDLAERAGDRLGAISRRRDLSGQRVGLMGDQLGQYEQMRNRALAEGNVAAAEELAEKMADLRVSIEEENQTRRELIHTYRQTATEIITGRQDRSGGLIQGASDILTKFGEVFNKSADVQARVLANARQIGATLAQEAQEIIGDVNQAVVGGEFSGRGNQMLAELRDSFQNGPEAFAQHLADLGPAIAALEATMGETERGAFQALIQSMIDNTTATLDNTQSVNDLTGVTSQPQTFTSTAWQWFRRAMFDGMGNVMPEYQIPAMQTGGYVTKGGLFQLHTGEFVVNAEGSNVPTAEGDVHVTVNEAGRPIDVTNIAAKVAFAKKAARAAPGVSSPIIME